VRGIKLTFFLFDTPQLAAGRLILLFLHIAAFALKTLLCSAKVTKHPDRLRDGFVFP
jgi:hypothetical protein